MHCLVATVMYHFTHYLYAVWSKLVIIDIVVICWNYTDA